MHLRQLGTALTQCPQPGGKAGADDTAPEHAVLVHHIKGRGSAKVHRDHRQRKNLPPHKPHPQGDPCPRRGASSTPMVSPVRISGETMTGFLPV